MNNNIQNLHGIIDTAVLKNRLRGYSNINDKIARLVKSGELRQILKAYYITEQSVQSGELSEIQLANMVYGPSYVSFFTALSYHGWIPEKVVDVESAVTKRSKTVETKLCTLQYIKVNASTFHFGIEYVKNGNIAFIIANPTKALLDLLWNEKLKYITGKKVLLEYLTKNLRIDEQQLLDLDLNLIKECFPFAKRKHLLKLLLKVHEMLVL